MHLTRRINHQRTRQPANRQNWFSQLLQMSDWKEKSLTNSCPRSIRLSKIFKYTTPSSAFNCVATCLITWFRQSLLSMKLFSKTAPGRTALGLQDTWTCIKPSLLLGSDSSRTKTGKGSSHCTAQHLFIFKKQFKICSHWGNSANGQISGKPN